MNRLLLAAAAVAGIAIAAMRFAPRHACRRRQGDGPGPRRSRGRRAMEDVAAIRENTTRILAILEEAAGTIGGQEPPGS